MTLLERQKEVAGYLMDGFPELGLRGLPLSGACPVVGNYTQENLCKAVTTGPLDHGSQGLAQWRLGRLTELRSWCAKNFDGDDDAWKGLEAQSAFTLFELKRDYPGLDAELHKGIAGVEPKDVRRVLDYKTAEFCWGFERPKKGPTAGLLKRQQHAASVFKLMDTELAPVLRPKVPVTPPPLVVIGGAAAVASAVAIPIYGGATILVTVVLAAVVIGAAAILYGVWYLMRSPKAQTEQSTMTAPLSGVQPLDKAKVAADNIVFWTAEYLEAVEEIKDKRKEEDELIEEIKITQNMPGNVPLGNAVDIQPKKEIK